MKREEILNRAKQAVLTRNLRYGEPEDNFTKIAELWSAYLGDEIGAHDVALMMCLFKIARASSGISADNYIDLCGYSACAGEIIGADEFDSDMEIPFDDSGLPWDESERDCEDEGDEFDSLWILKRKGKHRVHLDLDDLEHEE